MMLVYWGLIPTLIYVLKSMMIMTQEYIKHASLEFEFLGLLWC